jgi:hypothetical protein
MCEALKSIISAGNSVKTQLHPCLFDAVLGFVIDFPFYRATKSVSIDYSPPTLFVKLGEVVRRLVRMMWYR